MTYSLQAEREGKKSDHGATSKGEEQRTAWRWRGRAKDQTTVAIVEVETMHLLEVEEGKRSDCTDDCKGGRDNIRPGGGEGE
jgi:hypothetical protein